MANIRTTIFGPSRIEHLEICQPYIYVGTGTLGESVPKQIFIPLSKPYPAQTLAFDTWLCEAWVFCLINGYDQLLDYHQHDFPLITINLTEHGLHNRHVRRIELDPADLFHRAVLQRWNSILESRCKRA